MSLAEFSEKDISRRLKRSAHRPLDNPYPPAILSGKSESAAVLIPFLREDDGWHILLIRRTENQNDRHGGQVAFPGGRADPEDPDPEATAQREACEELGVSPDDVRILGRLNPILTITNYQVTPVVGTIPWPYPLKPAPDEVSRVFTVPLTWLSNPDNHVIRNRALPAPHPSISVIYFREYKGETLWGASARIALNLVEALA